MKRRTWMWLILAVLPTVTLAQYSYEPHVEGYLDVTFQSRYMWRGFKVFGNDSAMAYTAYVKEDTGFGAMLQPHIANGGGWVEEQRWDYVLFYENIVGSDERFALQYNFGYEYYNYPQRSSKVADLQELHLKLAMPSVFGVDGLVPSYTPVIMWQSRGTTSRTEVGHANGWFHIFALDYNIETPGLTPESPTQPVRLHTELVYNDGVNPIAHTTQSPVDNDWSHFIIGAGTDFDIGYNISITPEIYYQRTLDSSVSSVNGTHSSKDIVWFTLGAKWAF
ncbi:hypothetical protein ACFL6U_21350 [Planctomycetota bacterium]